MDLINLLAIIWTQPSFLLHLQIYWFLCFLFFLYDVILTLNNSQWILKYNQNYGCKVAIDWILYIEAVERSLSVQFLMFAPLMYLFNLLYIPHNESSYVEMIIKLFFCTLLEETLFYYSHRLMHTSFFWKYHKLHHTLITPVGVAALYSSYTENLIVNVLPVLISPYSVGLGSSSLYIWTILSSIYPILAHCGFIQLSWFSEFHALHHLKKNVNFGTAQLLDYVHGTYSKA